MGLFRNQTFLLLGLAWLLVFTACQNKDSGEALGTDIIDFPEKMDGSAEDLPKIVFDQLELNVGKLVQGEVVTCKFPFVNQGNKPLVISSVSGSCGCTIPRSYPTGKILPGEGGTIEVTFDSQGKSGDQTVTVSVVTNSLPSLTQLIIRTQILGPENP